MGNAPCAMGGALWATSRVLWAMRYVYGRRTVKWGTVGGA